MNGTAYAYDKAGDLVSRGTTTYTYDWQNHLVQVNQNGATTNFAYDGDGNLAQKTDSTGTTDYIGQYYEKFYPAGGGAATETKRYSLGPSLVAANGGGTLSYLHQDYLGSTVSASNGATVEYSPYGVVKSSSGTLPTDRQFQGAQNQSAIGLYHMGARWYDPAIGIWTQPDSIIPSLTDPLSLNPYSYTEGNPSKFVDPSGHEYIPPCDECNSGTGYPIGQNQNGGSGCWCNTPSDLGGSGGSSPGPVENGQRFLPGCDECDYSTGYSPGQGPDAATDAVNELLFGGNIPAVGDPTVVDKSDLDQWALFLNTLADLAVYRALNGDFFEIVYRVHDFLTPNNLLGPWWTRDNPTSAFDPNYRSEAGLPDSTNGNYLTIGILYNKVGVKDQKAVALGPTQKGGWQEYQMPRRYDGLPPAQGHVKAFLTIRVDPAIWGPIDPANPAGFPAPSGSSIA